MTMTYKTILVCLDEVNRVAALAAVSARIAELTGAHVRGLYVIPAAQIYPSTGFEAVPQVFEGHRTYFQNNKDSVRDTFEQAMKREGGAFDFIAVEGRSPLIADEVLNHGRSCDLIVMHATDPAQVSGVELDYIERVVMAVGRPILVLPRQGTSALKLDEVIVGWNAHREASRAVFDALPLLKAAKAVRLVWVDPQRDADLQGSVAGADLAESLARHDVNAIAEGLPSGGIEVGAALLQRAGDTGAGLLVMGAYGHSRLREFVFGGATRLVLDRMTLPVLMSH
jgi:nucleotide-binding universal stress UspA family protein